MILSQCADPAAAHLILQAESPGPPGRQLSSATRRQASGSLSALNPAQMAVSTSLYASLPRYCPLLMRMVGRMNTCSQSHVGQGLRDTADIEQCVWSADRGHVGLEVYSCEVLDV